MTDDARTCEVCGKPLEARQKKYCSRECRSQDKTIAELIIDLVNERYQFGLMDSGTPYVVEVGGPNLAIPIRGGRFKAEIHRAYHEAHGRVPNHNAVTGALSHFEGTAFHGCEPEALPLRFAALGKPISVGRLPEQIVVDLGDRAGRCVIVGRDGWEVANRSPVTFRRTKQTRPLPVPERGGTIDPLWDLVNVSEDDRQLFLSFVTSVMVPNFRRPPALLAGQPDAGKSTAAETIVYLVDPSGSLLQSDPKGEEDFAVSASSVAVMAYDNLARIPEWFSDALCRATTGGGLAKRQRYTDTEVSAFSFRIPVILTSIDPGALRGDLASRLLRIELDEIAKRKGETALEHEREQARPELLGALLDLLSQVMLVSDHVQLDNLPRPGDFSLIVAAVDKLYGTNALDRFREKKLTLYAEVVEGDPVASQVMRLVESHSKMHGKPWQGRPSELLSTLRHEADAEERKSFSHMTPRGLSAALKRNIQALRIVGVDVEYLGETNRGGHWRLSRVEDSVDDGSPKAPVSKLTGPSPNGQRPCQVDGCGDVFDDLEGLTSHMRAVHMSGDGGDQ